MTRRDRQPVHLTLRRDWILGFILIVGTFLVYQPVWHAGFMWDDDAMVTNNPLIRAPGGLWRIWLTTDANDYFPVTYSYLWLGWRLWGANAGNYHLLNIAFHALGAV